MIGEWMTYVSFVDGMGEIVTLDLEGRVSRAEAEAMKLSEFEDEHEDITVELAQSYRYVCPVTGRVAERFDDDGLIPMAAFYGDIEEEGFVWGDGEWVAG
jgi:hypothetical protein